MYIQNFLNSIIDSETLLKKKLSKNSSTDIKKTDCPQMLNLVSECLENAGRTQVYTLKKVLSPEAEYLRQLTEKYSQTDAQISQTKQDVLKYLKTISSNLEEIPISVTNDELETILAKKAVIDYLTKHISYNKDFREGNIGFEFGLPTKKILSGHLSEFQEEFNKSVSIFKKEGIFSLSDYNPQKHQFDAEDIMKKLEEKLHDENWRKYKELFDPITRLSANYYYHDPFLNSNADFYRIISPNELINLINTKRTKAFIDSDGYYTNGHYSCITTNPNYNEQAFVANGLPIRLKFKTKDSNRLYNMDLLNRIGGLKQERSIYRVFGYNFYDIDWDNVCIKNGNEWERLDKDYIEKLILQITK